MGEERALSESPINCLGSPLLLLSYQTITNEFIRNWDTEKSELGSLLRE